ncbi:A.superbus venom factor 1-like [Leptodactylus fuscus]
MTARSCTLLLITHNGLCEKTNLLGLLRTLSLSSQADWPLRLPELVYQYNNQKQLSTGYTPYYLMFRRHGKLPTDIALGVAVSDYINPLPKTDWVSDLQRCLTETHDVVEAHMKDAQARQEAEYNMDAQAIPFRCTLITPSMLHLESEETIVIDGHHTAFQGDIEIQDLSRKTLVKQKVSLTFGNLLLAIAKVKIPSEDFVSQPKPKEYVYVRLRSYVCNTEKMVLLSHQSGYIFIQTDKTIYTPGSKVLFRIFSMDYKMSPLNKTLIIEFLTPENKIVKRDTALPDGNSGITSLSYRLPDLVSLGAWTISAKFETTPRQTYTANFEVKEYVLPSFEIQLIPEQKYFYIDDHDFAVDIKARFLHGKPVNGIAFVVFGVKKGDARISLQDTLRRIKIIDGEGRAVMRREDLVKRLRNADEMLQYTLYMSVTITTDIGSEIAESELEDIPIVRSPFNVLFTKTSKYFKPGMPYDLTVFVTNPDGSPAGGIPVVAEPGGIKGTTGSEGTARLTLIPGANANVLPITVRTSHPALPPARQATASMKANAHQSGGNYLHIGITAAQVKPGDRLAVDFNIRNTNMAAQNQIKYITYLIMNKGRILKVERQYWPQGQTSVTISLPITEEFAPSFRIVGYYIVGDEIVSDSIWVEVTDTCLGMLSVTGSRDRDYKVQSPSSSMRLKLQADHMANVGLVVVDKGVYGLNSKYKISQKKLLEFLETSDHGCSPGSGADSMGVFYDAGLALQSSIPKTTPQRSGSKYKAPVRRCCADGMYPSSLSCERRAEAITEGKECVDAFLDCCKYIEQKRKEEINGTEQDEGSRREDEDDEYLPDAYIVSRSDLPESWFWKVEQMRERPDNKGISTKELIVFLKDSFTTWEVLAISLSQNKGLCIAKPYEIQVMKDFFIDLKLPYSAMRNEQGEIRAVLYNYGSEKIKVRVELTHNPHFCSHSTAKNKFRQIVDIEPQSSVAVPFTLVPLILGDLTVEVKAAIFGHFLSDGVVKKLKVVDAPEIEKRKECKNFGLSVTVQEEKSVGASEGSSRTSAVEICVRHLKDNDATMSILDISMMTGFVPDIESLNKMNRGVDKYISKYEFNKEAADKGTLRIYLDKISHKQDECIKFNVQQIYSVGRIQPGSVTVYEYNAPENRCTKFYHVAKDSTLLNLICQDGACRCATDNCYVKQQLEHEIDAHWRFEKACQTGVDYVYKVHLEEIQKKENYDVYVMKIIRVIKEGTEESMVNERRNFLNHISCRQALNLKQGSDYLIWGVDKDLWKLPSGYSYIIGKDTWIEWWPNNRECQKRENRRLCDDFFEFSETLDLNGCLLKFLKLNMSLKFLVVDVYDYRFTLYT